MNTSIPVQRVLDALRANGHEPKQTGTGWECCCPAHDDRNPSLSINAGDDGRALLKCHAGCSTQSVIETIGLKACDLFSDGHTTPNPNKAAPARPKAAFTSANDAVKVLERTLGPRTHDWTYHDAEGEPVGMVVRWDTESGKEIRPVSRNSAGWCIGGMPEPRPLYGLPELLKAEGVVYVCEGEKAADAARACGLIATTSPHGSKSASKADWTPLGDRDVVIIPDNDDPGDRYADDVSELARSAGARSVRRINLSDRWPELPNGGDFADAFDLSGGEICDVETKIQSLIDETDCINPHQHIEHSVFVPFPVHVFPEPIRSYVVDGARAIGCDPSFIALPMLSALGAAIGNTRRVQIKRNWTEPPIIWTAIVGESGSTKSPAMELALRPVRNRQRIAMNDHDERMKDWKVQFTKYDTELAQWKKHASKSKGEITDPPEAPDTPVCDRYWTDDTTTEALVSRLKENPRGLLMIRDELAGWFNFDRYAGGKGGGDVAKWLEMYGGRSLIVDRKSSGTEFVPNASVCIAGGVQPGILSRVLLQEHRESGLAARLLFAMPPRAPKRWTDHDVDEGIERAVNEVFDWLYALDFSHDENGDHTPRMVAMDAQAKKQWIIFVNEHGKQGMELAGDAAAAWSKLEGYAARFALVLRLTRSAVLDESSNDGDLLIDKDCVIAGIELSRWFANEGNRVYRRLSDDQDDQELTSLLDWIRQNGGRTTVRKLQTSKRTQYPTADEANKALSMIVEQNLGMWVHESPAKSGGRPKKWHVLNT